MNFHSSEKTSLPRSSHPIQNKVGQVLLSPMMRNILGQVRSKIDMRFMMDNKRIFIANLSKGKIGEDKANLLGSIILSKFQLAAMSRSDCDEKSRENFFLYADEFHNFTTESFTSMLSEARKYGLAMTLSQPVWRTA
jgi:type IV secretory pathway TraG/TraD family ATPase VirD4